MEKSRQLFWQGQRGELILVPLQQANLLPVTHKALSQRTPTHITPSQCVTTNNTVGSNEV